MGIVITLLFRSIWGWMVISVILSSSCSWHTLCDVNFSSQSNCLVVPDIVVKIYLYSSTQVFKGFNHVYAIHNIIALSLQKLSYWKSQVKKFLLIARATINWEEKISAKNEVALEDVAGLHWDSTFKLISLKLKQIGINNSWNISMPLIRWIHFVLQTSFNINFFDNILKYFSQEAFGVIAIS